MCQVPNHAFDTDIVGNVTVKLVIRQAKPSIFRRHVAHGMVGDNHHTAVKAAFDDLDWLKVCCHLAPKPEPDLTALSRAFLMCNGLHENRFIQGE